MNMQTKSADQSLDELHSTDLQVLEDLAQDGAAQDPPLAALARLEKFGLLMRGWGRTYVVTRVGERLLAQHEARVGGG